ncbi:MAG: hypothetical protein HEP71_20700 [Roseivirga sp.]|nr:hypothetical protein [Roseivirga sp.]
MSKLVSKLDLQGYITLSYLGAVGVGMMFDYQYYSHFGIDIFEYSDILDFLLTPARNLEVILFVIGTILIVWLLFRLDRAWEDKYPNAYRRFNFPGWQKSLKKYRSAFFVFSLLLYLFIASGVYGERKFSQFNTEPTPVSLTFESGSKTVSGSLIGKNKDYLFLQSADSTIKAIPINADVQEIVISKNGQ